MPSATEIVRLASLQGVAASPAIKQEVDERTKLLIKQVEDKLAHLEIFLAPTVGLPPKITAIPIVGATRIGHWVLRLYNRLFQRQQMTNRHLVDTLILQKEIIERLSNRGCADR